MVPPSSHVFNWSIAGIVGNHKIVGTNDPYLGPVMAENG
jgi:hypothetical protein